MSLLTLVLLFIRAEPPLTPLELHLETPVWAQNPQHLLRLVVFTATLWGIFMSTAQNTSVLTATSAPLATLSTIVFEAIVLFVATSATPPLLLSRPTLRPVQ